MRIKMHMKNCRVYSCDLHKVRSSTEPWWAFNNFWEATRHCNFSLPEKRMTMRKEVQQKSWTLPLLCKKKKKRLLTVFPLLTGLTCPQMENFWYLWLLTTRNHMRWSRKKITITIFISNTELLRNTVPWLKFLVGCNKNIRCETSPADQLS